MSVDASPRHCNPDEPPSDYREYRDGFDMVDTEEELAYWGRMRKPLETTAGEILPAYKQADAEAIRHQDRHRKLANAAAFFASVAVLLAIFQLAFPALVERLGVTGVPTLETASAVAALIAVALGIIIAGKSRWLLERHKAERLRFLKFGFLIDPDIWCDDARFENRLSKLQGSIKEVREMSASDYRDWLEELGAIQIPIPTVACPIDDDTMRTLVDYYRAKRLVYQKKYFENRTKRFIRFSQLDEWLAPVLFFGTVVSVLLHYALDLAGHGPASHEWSRFFIFLAASLPAVGAGIRTMSAVHHPQHNRIRYRSKEAVLAHVDEHLLKAASAEARIRDMEFCEQTLEFEHREWSRLMIATDVFP